MKNDKEIATILYNTLYWHTQWNNLEMKSVEYLLHDDISDQYCITIHFRNLERPLMVPIGITSADTNEYKLHIITIIEYINDLIYLKLDNGIPTLIKSILIKFGLRLLDDDCEYIWR